MKTETLWRLPWTLDNVPHALLDIIRGCNAVCRACYNAASVEIKTMEEVERDVDALLGLRKLHSLSIVGGEPLLHPDICGVIRLCKNRGVKVELFTNGALLTPELMGRLKEAGVDMVFLHIEQGQTRSDLSPGASMEEVQKLIDEKAAIIAESGVDAGLTLAVHKDTLEGMTGVLTHFIGSPFLNYLLITLSRQTEVFESIEGDLKSGLRATVNPGIQKTRTDTLSNPHLMEWLKKYLGLAPFACLGSNLDAGDLRWVSYVAGVLLRPACSPLTISLRPSLVEKFYMRFFRLLTGRYPFFMGQNAALFRVQLLLNALTGGFFFLNLGLFLKSFGKGTQIRCKRILIQNPADVDPEGRVVYCLTCPDAVVKRGKLVPVCLCDKVIK